MSKKTAEKRARLKALAQLAGKKSFDSGEFADTSSAASEEAVDAAGEALLNIPGTQPELPRNPRQLPGDAEQFNEMPRPRTAESSAGDSIETGWYIGQHEDEMNGYKQPVSRFASEGVTAPVVPQPLRKLDEPSASVSINEADVSVSRPKSAAAKPTRGQSQQPAVATMADSPAKLRDEMEPNADDTAQAEYEARLSQPQQSTQSSDLKRPSFDSAQPQPQNTQEAQDDTRDLLARYEQALSERNNAQASDANIAAMRAFNYQKAGANISAKDLMDPNAGTAALESYNESKRLRGESRQQQRDARERELADQKRATESQGDDPNSEYSIAAVEQAAASVGKPELAERLKGKVSANQVQKIFGNMIKPSMIEEGRNQRQAAAGTERRDLTAAQIASRERNVDANIASRERMQKERLAAQEKLRAKAAERLKSAGLKDADVHAGALAMELVPYTDGVVPNAKEPSVQKSLQQYRNGMDVSDRVKDLTSMIEGAKKRGVWGKLSAGEAAQFQTAYGQLIEHMSRFNDQGVVRDGDYARYTQQLTNPAEFDAILKDERRAKDQLQYILKSTGRQMDTVARGAGYRTARVNQEGKPDSLGVADQETLSRGWRLKEQTKSQQPKAEQKTRSIQVSLKDGTSETFYDVSPAQVSELKSDPRVASVQEM